MFIIFFDVSNNQSFLDVARVWLPLIRRISGDEFKNSRRDKIVLMANKIDKQAIMTVKSLEDFAENNQLKLMFCSN